MTYSSTSLICTRAYCIVFLALLSGYTPTLSSFSPHQFLTVSILPYSCYLSLAALWSYQCRQPWWDEKSGFAMRRVVRRFYNLRARSWGYSGAKWSVKVAPELMETGKESWYSRSDIVLGVFCKFCQGNWNEANRRLYVKELQLHFLPHGWLFDNLGLFSSFLWSLNENLFSSLHMDSGWSPVILCEVYWRWSKSQPVHVILLVTINCRIDGGK